MAENTGGTVGANVGVEEVELSIPGNGIGIGEVGLTNAQTFHLAPEKLQPRFELLFHHIVEPCPFVAGDHLDALFAGLGWGHPSSPMLSIKRVEPTRTATNIRALRPEDSLRAAPGSRRQPAQCIPLGALPPSPRHGPLP